MRDVIVLSEDSVISCFRFRFCNRAVAVALLMVFVLSGQALAIDWTNTTAVPDPWYHVGSNWAGGVAPDPNETANFNQAATYEVWWDLNTLLTTTSHVKFLDVLAGDVTFLNMDGGLQLPLIIKGSGGVAGSVSDFSISGSDTTLTNRGLLLHSRGGAQILNGATLTLDGSHAQGAQLIVGSFLTLQLDGRLNVEAGALASDQSANIGTTSSSTGEVTVTGSGSRWKSGAIRVGQSGNGTLNVEAGGVVSGAQGCIGDGRGSTGVATVSGIGSQWNNSIDVRVGDQGNGTLNVEAGGVVTNRVGWIAIGDGSTGVATVTGIGSHWNNSSYLSLGRGGHGALNVEAGGVVSNTYSNIGLFGGTGVATVTGIGSQWNLSENLSVGRFSHGTLKVEAGGVVNNSSGFIGDNSYDEPIVNRVGTGVATVTGAGSQWNNSGSLHVGTGGHATLNVEAGGVVSNTDGYIGESIVPDDPNAIAMATVTGSGTQWNNSAGLYLGGTESAAGETSILNALDNGLLSVATTLKIWGTGTLNLDGGTVQAETIDHTDGGTFDFLDGTLDVDTFDGNLTQNGGMIVIGSSPGITNVTGIYEQQGGAIEIEIFSSAGGSPVAATDFDQLTADSVMLSGTLDLIADPGYSPALGDTFPIINTNSGVSGMFGAVNNVSLPGGLTFEVIYGANDVTLEVVEVPEPDAMVLLLVGVALPGVRHRR